MQRFRGGLVFKAHRLRVSLNSRLESNKEVEERTTTWSFTPEKTAFLTFHNLESIIGGEHRLQLFQVVISDYEPQSSATGHHGAALGESSP